MRATWAREALKSPMGRLNCWREVTWESVYWRAARAVPTQPAAISVRPQARAACA